MTDPKRFTSNNVISGTRLRWMPVGHSMKWYGMAISMMSTEAR